ncbi:hypothetical protein WN51_08484 [Melipona quadrifasciata]|uniref:Uncharacterized protein n=1 Tax=Melipona quadrifasciata TaxID=166423 RepID=A0A0M9A7C1_9HYME|nr:hypothetical protein WN51_08484 [Melipona quadrifasciata]
MDKPRIVDHKKGNKGNKAFDNPKNIVRKALDTYQSISKCWLFVNFLPLTRSDNLESKSENTNTKTHFPATQFSEQNPTKQLSRRINQTTSELQSFSSSKVPNARDPRNAGNFRERLGKSVE